MMVNQRLTGTVKFFLEEKGWGFLVLHDGRELYVHASQVVENEPLAKAERITCIADKGHRGPLARQVTRI